MQGGAIYADRATLTLVASLLEYNNATTAGTPSLFTAHRITKRFFSMLRCFSETSVVRPSRRGRVHS